MVGTERASAIEEVHAATALYTSADVVDALLDRLSWPEGGGRLLDPSAGDGSFLLQALKRLDVNDPAQIHRIQGWEIHAGAVSEARARIAAYLEEHDWTPIRAAGAARRTVINRDFLTGDPKLHQFRTIAGNPPYLRFQRLPEYFKGVYLDSIPKYARGDLLHGFLDRCTKLLPENGVIGLVCSDRFLFNSTAGALRREMGNRVGICHVARLDASTSFYRPKQRVRGAPPRIHPVEIVLRSASAACRAMTSAAISPDGLEQEEATGLTLGDIAKVSLAPWLGPMGIFVVTGKEALSLHRRGADLIPAVDTDDIDPVTDELRVATRYAIRTRRETKPTAAADRHLRARSAGMPPRGRNGPYWVPPEPITLPLDKPALLIPRIARRLRAVSLPAGVLPINHNLSVINTTGSLEDLRELLLSEYSQAWIRRHAPRLDSGFFSITTRLLRRLPVE